MFWRLVLSLLALGCAARSEAYGDVLGGPRLVVIEENDALAARRDYGYTQGFRASLIFDDRESRGPERFVFDIFEPFLFAPAAVGARPQGHLEWVLLGQSIFTPQDKTALPPNPQDRPYAAWLYTGVSLARRTDARQLDSFELLAGVVGPSALGRQVQDRFHRLLGGHGAPRAWDYQLRDEPTVMASWDRRWKFGYDFGRGYGMDVIPAVGVSAGTPYTHAAAGALLRFGRLLSSTWGTARIRPSLLGSSFFSRPSEGDIGFAMFVGAEARAVARNVFLDGSTFRSGPSVEAHRLVGELTAGAELFTSNGSRISFSVTKRTAEFRDQPGRGDVFGTLEGTVRF